MAASFTCDGCNQAVIKPKIVGHVFKREYCEDCAKVAEEFLQAEEQLRLSIQEKFIDARAVLIANAPDGFKLPDVA